ncbi:MAG: DUF4392 domain-containing protein [Candidatus Korarchaeum sp.]|nr:DUF4392 domain-containing protein [Candidatus Korarchaeum sp.]MDW8035653.1 DUF4392 domain-containing protein [Candidatus Korarchaeum sp.]
MSSSPEHVCEGIDRLLTLDMSGRGVIYKLYKAARELTKRPLVLNAAEGILREVSKGDSVIIVTGFRVLPSQAQETDGPLGAASIARALGDTLGAKPVLMIERESTHMMRAALSSLGMREAESYEELLNSRNSFLLRSFPYSVEEAEGKAEEAISKLNPSMVLAIEKVGRATDGRYHTMRGLDVTDLHMKVEPLFERAASSGILTVGIGDGGNEVGMGNIREAVEDYVPNGKLIAAVSRVDTLICSAVSNWGGYGLSAALALLTGKNEALHTPEEEELMLRAVVEAGAVDGVTGRSELSVDKLPMKIHVAMIKMLEGFLGK